MQSSLSRLEFELGEICVPCYVKFVKQKTFGGGMANFVELKLWVKPPLPIASSAHGAYLGKFLHWRWHIMTYRGKIWPILNIWTWGIRPNSILNSSAIIWGRKLVFAHLTPGTISLEMWEICQPVRIPILPQIDVRFIGDVIAAYPLYRCNLFCFTGRNWCVSLGFGSRLWCDQRERRKYRTQNQPWIWIGERTRYTFVGIWILYKR